MLHVFELSVVFTVILSVTSVIYLRAMLPRTDAGASWAQMLTSPSK